MSEQLLRFKDFAIVEIGVRTITPSEKFGELSKVRESRITANAAVTVLIRPYPAVRLERFERKGWLNLDIGSTRRDGPLVEPSRTTREKLSSVIYHAIRGLRALRSGNHPLRWWDPRIGIWDRELAAPHGGAPRQPRSVEVFETTTLGVHNWEEVVELLESIQKDHT